MKRILSILMCLTIILIPLLCSCGNKADENNELNYLSDETYSLYCLFKESVNTLYKDITSGEISDYQQLQNDIDRTNWIISALFQKINYCCDESIFEQSEKEEIEEQINSIASYINEAIETCENDSTPLVVDTNKEIVATIISINEHAIRILDISLLNSLPSKALISEDILGKDQMPKNEYIRIKKRHDYKNFGFNSIYAEEQMNVWIELTTSSGIKNIFVDDPKNAYILTDGDYATMTFTNGFMKQERWDRGDDNPNIFYSIDREFGGYPWHSDQISIIDNNTVQLHNYRGGATLTIIDRKMYGSVPILSCNFKTSYTENTSEGIYIPAYFIDWTRSPERTTETIKAHDGRSVEAKFIRYYIKSDFLD